MKFSWSKILFYVIVLLGIIGLITLIATNPAALLRTVLFGAVIIGVIFILYKAFTGQKRGDDAAYRKAVRQSKKRHRDRGTRASHLEVIQSRAFGKKGPLERFKRRDHHHLTVIDGKKKRKKKLFFLE